jgi:hypothetical protein
MAFKKTVENFVCEHCGHENVGNGFTDHCEKCLWSKHVDVDPGDRKEECGGMMEPWDAERKGREYRVINRCQKCGFLRPSPILPNDDFSSAIGTQKKKGDLLR